MNQPTVMLAGGGSGGHVFPLLAVAEALRVLAPRVKAVFVGTARGLEAELVPRHGYQLELLEVLPIHGGVWLELRAEPGLRFVRCLPVENCCAVIGPGRCFRSGAMRPVHWRSPRC